MSIQTRPLNYKPIEATPIDLVIIFLLEIPWHCYYNDILKDMSPI